MSNVAELPRISIKTNVTKAQARPFVGRIVNDSMKDSLYDVEKKPYQWTIAVQPIQSPDGSKGFQIGGKTGAFWEYIPVPLEVIEDGEIKEQTKFGRHFNAFKSVFDDSEDRNIGRGDYLNQVAWFVKDTIEYGTNKQDGSIIKGSVLLPKRPLTDEELVEYGLAPSGTVASAQVGQYPVDELATLVAALNGKERSTLQKAAFTAKLPSHLRTGVGKGDGPAIAQAVAAGLATFDGDVFTATA